jgi:hypothetical protein
MNLGNEVVGPCDDRRTGLDLLAGRAGLSIRPTAQRRSAAAFHHVLYLFAIVFLFRCRTRATSGVRPFLLSPGDSRRPAVGIIATPIGTATLGAVTMSFYND